MLTERSPGGKYLPWGPGDEPFEKSKAALCDMWAEWEGMQGIVAQEKGPWPGIWLDNAAWAMGNQSAKFFAEYKRQGGELDEVRRF